MSPFAWRGVVEGFYGPAYGDEDRLAIIEAIGRRGMNVYVHAPKDDPLQREAWRSPYPEAERSRFARWVERGEAFDVRVGFALSPGLSIEYSEPADIDVLCEKFAVFRDLGCRFLSLQLDDVPSTLQHASDRDRFESLAHAHVALAHRVVEAIGTDVNLWLVPTDYAGTGSSDYLETLGRELPPEIEVAWTGRTVVSPTITAEEAAARAALLQRRLLLWDNYPVTDGPMRPMLHLGPYQGRSARLEQSVSGVLLNPMQHAHASLPALLTACDYLNDPTRYDAEESFARALDECGAGAAPAMRAFAGAHRLSPLAPDDRDPQLEIAFTRFRDARADERRDRLRELDALVADREAAPAALRSGLQNARLLAELEPWLESFSSECQRMRIAIDLHRALEEADNAMERFLAFSRFEGRLTHLATPAKASFGPRRVLYPQLRNHEDEATRFGEDPALFLDHCLADEIVRHAEATAAAALGALRHAAPR